MRPSIRTAALTLAALGALSGLAGTAPLPLTPLQAAPGPQRIAGTWDLSWKNSRGEIRRGSMVMEQRGAQLTAQVHYRGTATATGTISGSSFTLRGSHYGLPVTVTGRVQGRRISGTLTGIGLERRFTGVRRGRR